MLVRSLKEGALQSLVFGQEILDLHNTIFSVRISIVIASLLLTLVTPSLFVI